MWFMVKIINKNEKVDLVLGHTVNKSSKKFIGGLGQEQI